MKHLFAVVPLLLTAAAFAQPPDGLIGHWPLQGDTRDHSGQGHHGINHGVDLGASGPGGKLSMAAQFDGRRAWIEIPGEGIDFGSADFTFSVRVNIEKDLDDVPGDILSQYDPDERRGVNFGILSLPGSTASQPNDRNIHFGIDNAKIEPWIDHGQVGETMYVTSLCVFDGALYAATCEEFGHVYRFDGTGWVDCGTPDQANGIMAMAVLDGQLYVGSGRYRWRGSHLPETKNQNLGGSVFRYKGGNQWENCGRVSPETETIGGLVAYRGRLYATSEYKPAGMFRYEGGTKWTALGSSDGRRSEALGIHNGRIYTAAWDNGNVFEFDGQKFTDLGVVDGNTQTYGFINHGGELLVATWPKGKMYRWGGGQQWIDAGRLGEETEVMATAHYNGKVYAGTLPLAKVYRYDGDTTWSDLGQLDHTTDVDYRRVWSAAVYRGRLFVGTLPNGHVHSMAAGRVATVDRSLAPGWHHIAAVRRDVRLEIYLDGAKVAESAQFDPDDYDLSNGKPLRVGTGENDFFCGRMADLRIYDRALSEEEIRKLGR